jgi:transcriptional regulator with XRE-family HTH domain
VPAPKDLPRDIGAFIRDMRRNAKISLRQLADQAGVSNPYLSQIERGLRKPSAEVLQQLASALRVSTPAMYLRAGLLDDKEGTGVLTAIAVDPELTLAQKQSLSQIYETFRRENARLAEAEATAAAAAEATAAAAAEAAGRAAAGGGATVEPATASATSEAAAASAAPVTADVASDADAVPARSETTPPPMAKKTARKAVKKAAPAAEEE